MARATVIMNTLYKHDKQKKDTIPMGKAAQDSSVHEAKREKEHKNMNISVLCNSDTNPEKAISEKMSRFKYPDSNGKEVEVEDGKEIARCLPACSTTALTSSNARYNKVGQLLTDSNVQVKTWTRRRRSA